jgi:pimeloyl-ACP methyl ester carboxylesterase
MTQMNRTARRWAAAGLLGLLAAILLAHAARPAAATKPGHVRPTVVLVHGAWADSSSWSAVVRNLQRDGYTVTVPPNPLRGLSSDAAYLAGYLDTIPGPIVLVGHSYGGAVITNAATADPDVKALVYVNAFAPDEGETVVQLATAQPGSAIGGDPATVFDTVPIPGAPGDVDLYGGHAGAVDAALFEAPSSRFEDALPGGLLVVLGVAH